jgi:hypothetical protein
MNPPLTRTDYDAATSVIRQVLNFRDAEDREPGAAVMAGTDRSKHLRDSLRTLRLARDFCTADDKPEKGPPAAAAAGATSTRRKPRRRPRRARRRRPLGTPAQKGEATQ